MSNSYRKLFPLYQVATADDDTAGAVEIVIKSMPLPTDEITLGGIDVFRAGVKVTDDAVITYDKNTGILSIADGSTYAVTAGDVVQGSWTFRK